MRVVLDNNIFVSGIFWSGDSERILYKWKEGEFILISATEIILELITVLNNFKRKLEDELLKYWIDLIVTNSELVMIKNELKIINEDETDNKFIEVAAIGDADYIVTQDKHLLNLKEYKDIKIITPDKFLRVLEK